MDNKIYKLIYLSSETEFFNEHELLTILEKSIKNNKKKGITGVLLYSGGNFIQLLEGPKTEVESLFRSICKDKRHNNIIRLLAEYSDTRDFPDWKMGFRKITPSMAEQKITGFSRLLEGDEIGEAEMQNLSKKVNVLFNTFRRVASLAS
jgi:hypothetical protein